MEGSVLQIDFREAPCKNSYSAGREGSLFQRTYIHPSTRLGSSDLEERELFSVFSDSTVREKWKREKLTKFENIH